ncbi:MAG TPA: VOC family protein [Thermoanaerobaculia bacterium]|jgi:predicted enzyme related to lactoylglutathione lyase
MDSQPILGLRTVIYRVGDLERAKDWYRSALRADPYFDQPFYVGFNVGGFELGLDPDPSEGTGAGGSTAYWGVADAGAVHAHLLDLGAREHTPLREVGEGIKVATVLDPFGNVFGIIENPHFRIEGPALPNPQAP